MNSPNITSLVSKLRIRILPKQRQFKTFDGPMGRIKTMRKTVTALVKHERLELNFQRADEARGYAERLISEAIRNGDLHRPTMNLAKFWIEDEALVPKLFKVLVPRYKDWPSGLPYTRMLRAPSDITDHLDFKKVRYHQAVLELRGNPYPPLPGPISKTHPGMIHNVLLEEARKDYFRSQSKLAQEAELGTQALPDEDSCHIDGAEPENIVSLVDGLENNTENTAAPSTPKSP